MAANDVPATQALFRKHFQQTPTHVTRAPGRLELLGNHTDCSDGLVMALAVDQYLHIASSPRNDGRIELVSSAFPGRESFRVNELKQNPAAPWADNVKGVLDQLRRRRVNFSGFNAAIHSTIPPGAGLGNSAALAVAAALTVRKLFPFTLTAAGAGAPPVRDRRGELPPLGAAERMELARACHAAEDQFVGVPGGILDPIASLFGKAWSVIDVDCRALTVEHAPLPGEAIIVCDSNVKHEPAGGECSEVRQNCESAAKKLGAKSLRSVELKQVEAGKSKLAQREYECARHVVGEIARVVAGERALREDDHRQFGQYLFQSHESSRDFLRNSTPELDTLVSLARRHPGCLGARLTGGGFGGATINLVPHHEAPGFIEHMQREYEKAVGVKLTPRVCQIVDGAG